MMEVNMNLTFPIADWLFGTSDLDRGLIGHLFNGYDARFLKKGLRARPKSPEEAAAGLVGNELKCREIPLDPATAGTQGGKQVDRSF